MPSVTRVVSSMVVAVGLCVGAGGGLTADAAARPVKYKNCSALQKVYKHGVGKPKAKDKVAGRSKPVTDLHQEREGLHAPPPPSTETVTGLPASGADP